MWEWLLEKLRVPGRGWGVTDLARRLDVTVASLRETEIRYRSFEIPKRAGGSRQIEAPEADLKRLQRRIYRRLLSRLRTHSQATGFQRGESFLSNARRHEHRAIVIHFDIRDFFPSISADRVVRYFRAIGWNRPASRLLTRLVTYQGVLPQGAPTSPRLSNLVNYRMDVRLAALTQRYDGSYTRYADDITISLTNDETDVKQLVQLTLRIIREEGYEPHVGRKFDVRRRHQQQMVTGLVVNSRANLPRTTRRWLRAVAHRTQQYDDWREAFADGATSERRPLRRPTLSHEQLAGWQGLLRMIERAHKAAE